VTRPSVTCCGDCRYQGQKYEVDQSPLPGRMLEEDVEGLRERRRQRQGRNHLMDLQGPGLGALWDDDDGDDVPGDEEGAP
jgi:hypothetical protein